MTATARRVPSAWGAVLAGAAPPSLLLGDVSQRFPCLPLTARGHSSVGRAFGLHPKGRGSNPAGSTGSLDPPRVRLLRHARRLGRCRVGAPGAHAIGWPARSEL